MKSPLALSSPRLRAADTPRCDASRCRWMRSLDCTTARIEGRCSASEPSSTTMISYAGSVCARTDRTASWSNADRFRVGITTETVDGFILIFSAGCIL